MGEANTAAKGGKKNRKHKRSLRSPAMQRYNATHRDAINRERRMARHARQCARKAAKLARRAARRAPVAQPAGEPS